MLLAMLILPPNLLLPLIFLCFNISAQLFDTVEEEHLNVTSDFNASDFVIPVSNVFQLLAENQNTTMAGEVNLSDFPAIEDFLEFDYLNGSQVMLESETQSPVHVTNATNKSGQWPVKHAAIVEGDVVLGGLMMVHEREDTVTCGPIMPQGGVQALEAMLYTLDRINTIGLLPNFTLGAHILDDCDKDTYGLEMALDFIKGKWCFRPERIIGVNERKINLHCTEKLMVRPIIRRPK